MRSTASPRSFWDRSWMTDVTRNLRVDRAKLVAGSLSARRRAPRFKGRRLESRNRGKSARTLDRRRLIPAAFGSHTPAGKSDSCDPAQLQDRAARPTYATSSRAVWMVNHASHPASYWRTRFQADSHRVSRAEFGCTESVQFRFKLDGFEPQWGLPVAGEKRFTPILVPVIGFTSSPSGCRRGLDETEATLAFGVASHAVASLAVSSARARRAGVAAGRFYQLRCDQGHRTANSLFEARLAERLALQRELHDTLLQAFTPLAGGSRQSENLLPATRTSQGVASHRD